MNRPMLAAVAVALLSSGCVVRAHSPRVVVSEPALPPPVVVAPPPPVVVAPPPPVVVAPTPVVVHPPVLVSQPKIVIVPGTQVYTVPSASFNVFVYGGHYYSFHHGTWFHAPRHGAAWSPVAVAAVPVQVRNVPAKHWKGERAERFCPPGHAKKGEC
jgi:hypothetical protein